MDLEIIQIPAPLPIGFKADANRALIIGRNGGAIGCKQPRGGVHHLVATVFAIRWAIHQQRAKLGVPFGHAKLTASPPHRIPHADAIEHRLRAVQPGKGVDKRAAVGNGRVAHDKLRSEPPFSGAGPGVVNGYCVV